MPPNSGSTPFDYHELAQNNKARIVANVVAEAQHDDTRKLIDYWKECGARGGLKLGRDLPAASVARLMSRLVVFEPVQQNTDFRIRLAGAGLIRRHGFDISGRLLSEVFEGAPFESYAGNLCKTLTSNAPLVIDAKVAEGPNQLFHIEYVFLPALSYDGNENWVVVGAFYFD